MTQADTPLICLPWFSETGHVQSLAQEIAAGVEASGARAVTMDVTDLSPADRQALDAACLIAFGCPTYMGSTPARYSLFLEEAASTWPDLRWQDKLAAGFVSAIHPSGDKLSALSRLSIYAAQMGMIWVGQTAIGAPVYPDRQGLNADGSWLGLMATDSGETLRPEDAQTARHFGTRLAQMAARWERGSVNIRAN